MKNYRALQNCLTQSLEDLKAQRKRAESLLNGLVHYLQGYQGIPQDCVFFAIFADGQVPAISRYAENTVALEENRVWSTNLVFRVHEPSPQGETSHVILNPTIQFREDEIVLGVEGIDTENITLPNPEGTTSLELAEPFANLVTEACARKIEEAGGEGERSIGFKVD